MNLSYQPIFNYFDIKNKIKDILNNTIASKNNIENEIIITYIKWNENNNKIIWNKIKYNLKQFIIDYFLFDKINITYIKNKNNIIGYNISIIDKIIKLYFKSIILDKKLVKKSLNSDLSDYCIKKYNHNNNDEINFDFKYTDYIGIIINNQMDELYNLEYIIDPDSDRMILNLLANKIITNLK